MESALRTSYAGFLRPTINIIAVEVWAEVKSKFRQLYIFKFETKILAMCPSGRALFRYATTQLPLQCHISPVSNTCPPGLLIRFPFMSF